MKKKIIVRGPALTQSGYGEQCRFALRSLREYEDEFDIYLVPVSWGNTSWHYEDTEERRWLDEIILKTVQYQQSGGTYDMSLQVTIPNEWERLAPVNIGYTAGIETTKVAPQWLEKTQVMDRIIVVSNHAKSVFESTSYKATNSRTGEEVDMYCQTPITVVNYPVRDFEPIPVDLELDYDFNFLTMAQWGPRKNLENTVRWFVEEFKDEEVGLVVKTSIASNSILDKGHTEKRLASLISQYEDRKCKVYLVHGNMKEGELTSLYKHPKIKAMVNLAHGEGYGLPLFEAAYNELPVIAPDWSGQCDFLFAPVKEGKKKKEKLKPLFAKVAYNIRPVQPEAVWNGVIQADSMWCYPMENSYKGRLREMVKDYSKFKTQAKKLNKWIRNTFTAADLYEEFAEATLGAPVKKVEKEELPKISVITSVYNGDEYIKEFLEDITSQTIFDKCELILVNANSPGNEEETIKEYLEKYDNIVYEKLEEDPGIYGTWNYALGLATGEYVTNANLDDRKVVNSLEKHAKELYLNPNVDLVYADMLITDAPNETFVNNSSNGRKYTFPEYSFENLKMVNMPHASPMWRKDLHDKHGVFDAKYKSAGDWEMWLRAASNGSTFKKINDVLGLYYFNPKGISTNPDNFDWKREEEREIFEKYNLSQNEEAA
jgi:GT2 family glycosyltransferase